MYAQSLFIPHVDKSITMDFVVAVLENKFDLGKVSRIESIPKVSNQDGHEYYCCYVYFDTWTSSPGAVYLQSQFTKGASTKMYYWDKKFWVVCLNTSPLRNTVHEQPKHMSLTTYLPADITIDTCWKVAKALDLGEYTFRISIITVI